MGVAQNFQGEASGGVTQVLIHVSTYQGKPLEVPIFDPPPLETLARVGGLGLGGWSGDGDRGGGGIGGGMDA